MKRRSGSKVRLIRLCAVVLVVSWGTQSILAMAISPFVQYRKAFFPQSVMLTSNRTDVILYIRSSYRLEPITWTPARQSTLFLDWFLWPPSTTFLSGIDCGWHNDVEYRGWIDPSKNYRYDSWVHKAARVDFPAASVLSHPVRPDEIKKTRRFRYVETAVGWPFPSMYGSISYRLGTEPDPVHGLLWESLRYEWAAPVPAALCITPAFRLSHTAAMPEFFVPLKPILTGSVLNTAFFGMVYTAIWTLTCRLWRIISGATKRERKKRGECVKCGYPLEGLQRCPECGAAAYHKAR